MRLPILLLTLLFAWPTHAQMTLRNGALRNWSNCDSRLLNGLVSYYKLDETSGTRADSYGTNNLTANNSPSYATGKIGNAATFVAASSQHFSSTTASTPISQISALTISFWFKLQDLTGKQGFMACGAQYDYANDIDVIADGAVCFFQVNSGADGSTYFYLQNDITNTWAHLVCTFDGNNPVSTNRNEMWLNGQKQSVTQYQAPTKTPNVSGKQFLLGRYIDGNGYSVNGSLDECGIWTRKLSDYEIAALYKQGNATTYPSFARSRRIPESLYDTPANPLLAALYRKPEPISLDIP